MYLKCDPGIPPFSTRKAPSHFYIRVANTPFLSSNGFEVFRWFNTEVSRTQKPNLRRISANQNPKMVIGPSQPYSKKTSELIMGYSQSINDTFPGSAAS